MNTRHSLWAFFLGCVVGAVLMGGCKREGNRSALFTKIFKDETTGTFRGIDLGVDLALVKEKEGTTPKLDDEWGYVFEYSLGGKSKFIVEYLSKDPKSRKVNAIVANILLDEKAEASVLFTEMESHLRNGFGVAEGNVGNLTWRDEERNLLASLRMLDDKQSISLSFGSIQSF